MYSVVQYERRLPWRLMKVTTVMLSDGMRMCCPISAGRKNVIISRQLMCRCSSRVDQELIARLSLHSAP